MTEHADQIRADQIRKAFESHEHLAPDTAAVLARAEELARTYRRRRIGAQAAGGAVLATGLVAGGIGLPNLLGGGSKSTVIVQGPAAGGAATTPPVTTPPSPSPEFDKDLQAYFDAGYELDDSKKLAKLWNLSAEPENLSNVKAEAGRRLLAGEKLPVKPNPANVENVEETSAAAAFFDAGYDFKDAKKLSKLWKTDDVYQAKVIAGKKIKAGESLPIQP
jgi:hypothetical protein